MPLVHVAELSRRGVVAVAGADAPKFLDDLVTADVSKAGAGRAVYAGLLSPQGKIIVDFIVFRDGDRFIFDLPRALVADFVKRLGFYRLRAKVTVEDLSATHRTVALWGEPGVLTDLPAIAAPDPRLEALGFRAVVPVGFALPAGSISASAADYDARRIALGVPESAIDFAFGEAFPHDADMDQFGGVDFKKGCYVGQEVVSRMEHRGTARRRVIQVRSPVPLPARGTAITAAGRPLGSLGSSVGGSGLALVRLDRAKAAMDSAVPILAGDAPVTLTLPPWATFGWPTAPAAEE